MENPHITFLIFSNGKVMCVGARKMEEAYKALNELKKMVEGGRGNLS